MGGNIKKIRAHRMLNQLLVPASAAYRLLKKIAKRTKKSVPLIYGEIESIIKSHLVTLEKDKDLLHDPDINGFADVITANLVRKLPNIDAAKLNRVIADKSSTSFLDLLTRGLGGTIEKEKDYTTLSKGSLFKRVLVANRGEIALRVIRACKELGISTVAIYSNSDKDSLAVKFSDKAYSIGSDKNYLDINKVISIAKKANADAIHPGYGFLAENAEFARLCKKNKIKFVGPSVKAINMMGNKIIAKDSMLKAAIPVISGTSQLKDVKTALKFANKIGYPVIIKAAAGGGGKGMRIVRGDDELEKSFSSAEAEAEASFGDKALYLEKYFDGPRHIEFQILADKHGNVVHLGERDCSVQRRHQKLIEEAPSPALNKALREKMGDEAVRVAKIAAYEGAGTVEFLFDNKDNKFYFMEMNTRIQVEHGITEMITGVDLVKEQIKIASGAKLAFSQEDIKIRGWAIECRINAEDPCDNFRPSIGTVMGYLPPGGPGIRVCSSCHTGHVVSPHYDSLIAKLMCGGRNRNEAINRMRRALSEYVIEGVETTIPFHKAALADKDFVRGNVSTSFIENNKILEQIKKCKRPKRLTNGKRTLIIATAASEYMNKKYNGLKSNKASQWVIAGRQELMSDERSF